MNKIPTLFKRDFTKPQHPITHEYNDGVEWVLNGEGVATRKYDGMCCMIRDGRLYKRCEVKPGKNAPEGFEQVALDDETGKAYGWLLVGDGPEDKYFREAWDNDPNRANPIPGTYELVGPKVQSNPERYDAHNLIWHEDAQIVFPPVTFDDLKVWLTDEDIEGIVWHHPDGRMVKIKKKDFGLKRVAA